MKSSEGGVVATDPITAGLARAAAVLVIYFVSGPKRKPPSRELTDLVHKVEAASTYRVAIHGTRLAVNNGIRTQWMSQEEFHTLAERVLGR
jgi:hypothetical protein